MIRILLNIVFPLLVLTQSFGMDWGLLKSKDHISIIAPGYGKSVEIVENTKKYIEHFGFTPNVPKDLIKMQILGYSNTLEYRTNHLKKELTDPNTKVIWALCGGRGSSEVVGGLPDMLFFHGEHPPFIVGFSDITALHLFAAYKGWPSLHAIVLSLNKEAKSLINGESSLQEVFDILTGKVTEVSYHFTPLNPKAKEKNLCIESSIVGGNASLIQRSMGTKTQLKTWHKILFLEDTGEQAVKMQEILVQMDRAHIFDDIQGLIWGNFSCSEEEITHYNFVMNELAEQLNERGIPMVHSVDFGHGKKNNPLPFGTKAVLKNLSEQDVLITIQTNNK